MTLIPKCDFNNVALQLYWNHTSVWLLSCKFAAYFKNTFLLQHLWRVAYYSLKLVLSISVFRTLSDICDGTFLRKSLTTFSRLLFLQKCSSIDVWYGPYHTTPFTQSFHTLERCICELILIFLVSWLYDIDNFYKTWFTLVGDVSIFFLGSPKIFVRAHLEWYLKCSKVVIAWSRPVALINYRSFVKDSNPKTYNAGYIVLAMYRVDSP